jgi:hypothetical protein
MSPPNFNILPETVQAPARGAAPDASGRGALSTTCGRPAGEARGGAPRGGGGGGAPGGAGRGGQGGGGGAAQPPVDAATQLARSNLPGLAKGKIAVFLGWGEIDSANIWVFDEALKNALCKAGRCPTSAVFKDHSHVSLVFSPNTRTIL